MITRTRPRFAFVHATAHFALPRGRRHRHRFGDLCLEMKAWIAPRATPQETFPRTMLIRNDRPRTFSGPQPALRLELLAATAARVASETIAFEDASPVWPAASNPRTV